VSRTLEFRSARAAKAVTFDGGSGRIFGVAVTYDVVDDYGTRFSPGVFADSLKNRLPTLVWGHDWSDPIGRVVDYNDTSKQLEITAQLDDPAAVPRARQAFAQLKSGTLRDMSVGFLRQEDQKAPDNLPGVTDITRGILDEVSLVLVGAVPGSQVTDVRGRPRGRRPLRAVDTLSPAMKAELRQAYAILNRHR
jgi:HK97 family phage prohead protease